MTSLPQLVKRTHESALASKALVFFPSTVAYIQERGVMFEIRVCPALGAKPKADPARVAVPAADKPNPFLPYDPALFVDTIGPKHNLLLNKFCIIPGHLLLTTKAFAPQGDLLDEEDFAAVETVLDGLESDPHLVFFNGGPLSGASQPHKHLQIVPLDHGGPPILSFFPPSPGETHRTSPDLPFAHLFKRILQPATAKDSHLHATYRGLHDALGICTGESYNLIFTREWMLMVPRTQEKSREGLAINSLGYAGLILAKTTREVEIIRRATPLGILSQLAPPLRTLL